MIEQSKSSEGSSKCTVVLCIALILSFTLGVIILNIGYTLLERMGNILNKVTESVWDAVRVKSALSETMQNIAPTGRVPEDVQIGKWHNMVGFLLCFWAVLMMVIALFGFYSGFTRVMFLLIVTVIMLFIPWCIMIFVLSIFVYAESSFHHEARDGMLERLHKEYTVETDDNPFVFFLNAIMLWYECCGIAGNHDFKNLTFTEKSHEGPSVTHMFEVAPACCARSLYNNQTPVTSPFTNILNCAVTGLESNIKGCYVAVFNDIRGSVIWIISFLIIWNLLVIVLAMLAIREIQKEEEELQRARHTAHREKPHSATPHKKFTPMAKKSSWFGGDVHRIRSTEIW